MFLLGRDYRGQECKQWIRKNLLRYEVRQHSSRRSSQSIVLNRNGARGDFMVQKLDYTEVIQV